MNIELLVISPNRRQAQTLTQSRLKPAQGIDVIECDSIFLAYSGGHSTAQSIQRVGRAVRVDPCNSAKMARVFAWSACPEDEGMARLLAALRHMAPAVMELVRLVPRLSDGAGALEPLALAAEQSSELSSGARRRRAQLQGLSGDSYTWARINITRFDTLIGPPPRGVKADLWWSNYLGLHHELLATDVPPKDVSWDAFRLNPPRMQDEREQALPRLSAACREWVVSSLSAEGWSKQTVAQRRLWERLGATPPPGVAATPPTLARDPELPALQRAWARLRERLGPRGDGMAFLLRRLEKLEKEAGGPARRLARYSHHAKYTKHVLDIRAARQVLQRARAISESVSSSDLPSVPTRGGAPLLPLVLADLELDSALFYPMPRAKEDLLKLFQLEKFPSRGLRAEFWALEAIQLAAPRRPGPRRRPRETLG